MSVIYVMLPFAVVLGTLGVVAFLWSVRRGQFDDLQTPAIRVLFDDAPAPADRRDVSR